MVYRITPHRQYELGQLFALNRYAQGSKLQQQISTGLRVSKPSDDPAAQKVIINQQTVIQRFTTQLNSLGRARSILNDAQTQVRDAQQLLVTAKNIAMQASQTTDESERNVLAGQLDSILNQLDEIANSSSNGQYLFSGLQSGTRPFSGINTGTASYQGSRQAAAISLPGHPDIKTYYSGQQVFQPPGGGTLVVMGNTGVQPGTGTSSGAAPSTLTVKHTLTTYAGGSGVQAGSGSADGDTILGPAGKHTLTIHDTSGDGSAGTISLDGGTAVAFTSSDANLQVTGPNGQVVYVNTQAITAGFNGTIDITAEGTLSIDGGATETAIDFSTNQALVDSATGAVFYFDTSGATATGTAAVEPDSISDIFQVVKTLRNDILNVRGLGSTDLNAAIGRRIQDLDNSINHLLSVVGEQSVSLEHLDTLESRMQDLQLNAQSALNDAQGTDYATAVTRLQEQQSLLQYTLTTLTTFTNISVLDYMK